MDNLTKNAKPITFRLQPDVLSYKKFSKDFDNWIYSSSQKIIGLPHNSYIVSGITDAFNQLYGMYNKFGIFDGEYGYHQLVLNPDRITYNLQEADCIIISHPFSADGLSSISKIEIADMYNKPIFIDCAFFGLCSGIDFDFSQFNNISTVAFSLSKTFGTGFHRVGKIYSCEKFPASVYEQWGYPLVATAEHHYNILQTVSPDDTFAKYRSKQVEVCSELGLIPSDTVIFGLDYTDKYNDFKRGQVNRICVSDLLT